MAAAAAERVVPGPPATRSLTFDDRVRAQEAIERVYYKHQIGTTKPFEEAVTRSVLEAKVRKYVEQTAALQHFWKTAVTGLMLERELERMASGTRMPERLLELYAALGNDAFLIEETLARATLVDRLVHNFHAFDPSMHAEARREAEELHRRLVSGEVDPLAADPRRTVFELGVASSAADAPSQEAMGAAEFKQERAKYPARPRDVSPIRETRESFAMTVVLDEGPGTARIATYAVAKPSWDSWWTLARARLPITDAPTIAIARMGSIRELPPPPVQLRTECADDTWDNGGLDDTPEPRSEHAAVWTGSMMLVWGGNEFTRYGLRTYAEGGWRYDPATDTWSAMSTVAAPIPRVAFSAVWTGRAMLVWGGLNNQAAGSDGFLDSGGRYDPVTNSWAPMSATDAPSRRYSHSAAWTGSQMVVWGGRGPYQPLATGSRYDPQADRWTAVATSGAPSSRVRPTMAWTGRSIVVWGGSDSSGAMIGGGGQYDPRTDTWNSITTTNEPAPRSHHVSVWSGRELIIWGGFDVHGYVIDTGGRYDPTSDTWRATSTSHAASPRGFSKAVWTGQIMFVWGGEGSDLYPIGPGGRYDPGSDSWTSASAIGEPFRRLYHSLIWTGQEAIVWGGGDSGYARNDGGRYRPSTDSWTPTSTGGAPTARTGQASVWTGNHVIVWGGQDLTSHANTGSRYDPSTDTWSPTATEGAPGGRRWHTATWTGESMAVWGGYASPYFDFAAQGGLYDPIADSWSPMSTTNAPRLRANHTAVWTGHRLVIWGGYGRFPDYSLASGALYDPSTDSWSPTTPTGAPSGRYHHTAVWTGSAMVVWGGLGDGALNTGGRYDPETNSWSPTTMTGAPASRYLQASVWTGDRMLVWGGHDPRSGFDFGSGAGYDPFHDIWSPMADINAPSPRYQAGYAWTGAEMLIWGGTNDDQDKLGDGGRYDPATDRWRMMSQVGAPPGRIGHTAEWTGHELFVWGGTSVNSYPPLNKGGRYVATFPPVDDCDGDGFSIEQGDCDDRRAAVYPGAEQVCDGINDDCLDPAWPSVSADEADVDGDGTPVCGGDCDDTRGWVYPGAPERCDEMDEDCDGIVNNGGDALCDDGNSCTADSCDGSTCLHLDAPGDCDDGNLCTGPDVCVQGVCTGAALEDVPCDDANACTTDDVCAGGYCAGDVHNCDDLDPCNGVETCNPIAGCVAGTPLDCDLGYQCYAESCEPFQGCVYTPIEGPCNDGYQCTIDDHCQGGSCRGTPTYYTACEDGDPCTTDDWCGGYQCHGGEWLECDDGNACTDDGCSTPLGGCVYYHDDANGCSDADPCSQADACHSGTCSGIPIQCTGCPAGFGSANGLCTKTYSVGQDLLDNQLSVCASNGTRRYNACNDRDYGFHWLDLGRGLLSVVRVDLHFDGGYECAGDPTGVSLNGAFIGSYDPEGYCSCHPEGSHLVSFVDVNPSAYRLGENNSISIDPAGWCGGLSASPSLGDSFAQVTVTYAPHDPDCQSGTCVPAEGCVYTNVADGTSCDDERLCTDGDACLSGACTGAPVPCDDGNACTSDACDAVLGCTHDDDSEACSLTEECTIGSCDPELGCVFAYAPIGTACDDFDRCTLLDQCDAEGHCLGQSFCDDWNPCTLDYADPWNYCSCTYLSAGGGTACEDGDACTFGEACDGQGLCVGGSAISCDDSNPCTYDVCDPASGCTHEPAPEGTTCDNGNACDGAEYCDGYGSCYSAYPPQCDDRVPCTLDGCDPETGCTYSFYPAGTSCGDGDVCNGAEVCNGEGECAAPFPLSCGDANPCTDDSCDSVSGCHHTNNSATCDDGNACTTLDVCSGGSCQGTTPVVCAALDQCHDAGVCDPASGLCSSPARPDGTLCDDASLCTTGDTCVSGTCTPAFNGLNEPNPRSTGHYKRLCIGPHSGDELTDVDAACVATVASTFAGIATVTDLCAELLPSQPNFDPCDRTEDDLMVLALNICRARVCAAQGLESQCGSNSNVAQSLAESNAILSSASRTSETCAQAKCLDEEINTGRALELNSLTLRREGGGVRLAWREPFLNDGGGHPTKYHVWRRVRGSLAPFTKVASPVDPTYLDTGEGSFEYEVTAVMN